MKLTAKLRCSKVRYVEPVVSLGLLNSGAIYCWQVKSVNIKTITVACVASVSVRFRSKERGKSVKDRAENGLSKRAGRGWGRKEGNFLPSPSPPPTFIFWLLSHFLRGQNRKSRSSVFLYSETKRKRFLRRLLLLRLINVVAWKIVLATDTSRFHTYNFCFAADRRKTSPHKKIWKAFWNLESVIWENFACGIRNTAQGIQKSAYDSRIQNPSFTDKEWNPVPRIRNPWRGIQDKDYLGLPLGWKTTGTLLPSYASTSWLWHEVFFCLISTKMAHMLWTMLEIILAKC